MSTILVNHTFIQDANHPEFACTRCGGLMPKMNRVYFQATNTEQIQEFFEAVCAGPGSARWGEDKGLAELRRIAEL